MELIQIQARSTSRTNSTLKLNSRLYRGEMLESLKGTYALKKVKDSLAYMARLDWPRGQSLD